MLGLLSGSGSSDATAYTSNELKYNHLTTKQWENAYLDYLACNNDEECIAEVDKKWLEIFWKQRDIAMACDTFDCLGYYYNQYRDALEKYNQDEEFKDKIVSLIGTGDADAMIFYQGFLDSNKQEENRYIDQFHYIVNQDETPSLNLAFLGSIAAGLGKNPGLRLLVQGWNNAKILNSLRSFGSNYTPSLGSNSTVLVGASAAEAQIVTAGRVVSTVGGNVSNSTRALYGSSAITSPQLWGLSTSEWASLTTGSLVSYYSVVGMNNFTGINWDWRLPGTPDQRGEFNEPIPGFTPVMVGPQATINPDQSGWWRDLLKNTGYRPDSMPVEPIVTPRPEIQGPTIYNQVPGGGLQAHENAGGHAIANHVGKTDAELLARFQAQPYLRASSTFSDLATADALIEAAIIAK